MLLLLVYCSAKSSSSFVFRCSLCLCIFQSAIVSADTFVRPIYAASLLCTVQSDDAVKVITVRASAFEKAKQAQQKASLTDVALLFFSFLMLERSVFVSVNNLIDCLIDCLISLFLILSVLVLACSGSRLFCYFCRVI